MATKTKNTKRTRIEKVAHGVLGLATKANSLALQTTEKAFTTSFKMTEKGLGATHMLIKKGLEISASQQDLAFDVLKGIKKKIVKK
jgi:hypothetical protein